MREVLEAHHLDKAEGASKKRHGNLYGEGSHLQWAWLGIRCLVDEGIQRQNPCIEEKVSRY